MKTICYSFALFLIQSISLAQDTGNFHTTIQFEGQGRRLSFFVPTTYDASQHYNLIVGLHGLGDESNNYRNALVASDWESAFPNTIFVCPDGGNDQNSDFYAPVGDEEIIQAAINYTVDEYTIDTNEIVLQGFSLGGRSALNYGLAHPDKFKGLYLHTPALQGRADVENNLQPAPVSAYQYANASQIPIYITVGETDVLYEYTLQGLYPILKQNNGIVKYKIIPGLGHTLPPSLYIEEGRDFINQNELDSFSVDIFDIEVEDRICETSVSPKCLVRNTGSETLTSIELNYSIDAVDYTYTWSGTLNSFEYVSVELPQVMNLTSGSHSITCELGNLNSTNTDLNIEDNTQEAGFITGESIYTLPYTEDFEGDLADWYFEENFNLFEWVQDDETSYSGNNSLSSFNSPFIFNTQGLKEAVYSPLIDLSGAISPLLTVSFKHAFNYIRFAPPVATQELILSDTLEVFISTDCGATYTSILKKAGADLATASLPILNPLSVEAGIFAPADTNWGGLEMDISAYASAEEARFKIECTSNLGGTIFIDDFKVNYQSLSTTDIEKERIQVYPNPAQEYIQISNLNTLNTTIRIVDITGKVVVNKMISHTDERIDISQLAMGSYIVNIITDKTVKSDVLIIGGSK